MANASSRTYQDAPGRWVGAHQRCLNILAEAKSLENRDMSRALTSYREGKKKNTQSDLLTLFLAFASPFAAFCLYSIPAFRLFMDQLLPGDNRNLSALVTMAVLGYAPPILRYIFKYPTPRKHPPKAKYLVAAGSLGLFLFIGPLVMFVIVLVAVLVASPVVLLLRFGFKVSWQDLPSSAQATIALLAVAISAGFLVAPTKIWGRPASLRAFVSDVLVAYRLGWRKVAFVLSSLALGLTFVWVWDWGLRIQALPAFLASGLVLGLVLFRWERDPILGYLLRLGEERCLVHLSRDAEARYVRSELDDTPDEVVARSQELVAELEDSTRPESSAS